MFANQRRPGIESSEWNRLGSVFYERRELYSWSVEIGSCRVQSAGNGGPIAVVVPDTNNLQRALQVSIKSLLTAKQVPSARKVVRPGPEYCRVQFRWAPVVQHSI